MGSRTITDDECKAIADLVAFRTGDYIPEFQVKAIIETFINRPVAKPTSLGRKPQSEETRLHGRSGPELRSSPSDGDPLMQITAQTLREMDDYEEMLFATGMVDISEHVIHNAELVLMECELKIKVTESDDEGNAIEWEVRDHDETGDSEFAKQFSDPDTALAYAQEVVTRHFRPMEN